MVESAQRRLRRKVVGGMIASFVILAALLFAGLWPAAVLGLNGQALKNSIDVLSEGSCEQLPNGKWRCRDTGSYYSDSISYRVEVDSFGCWTAHEEEAGGKVRRGTSRSGCVRLASYLP
jgi:hypothetical protein